MLIRTLAFLILWFAPVAAAAQQPLEMTYSNGGVDLAGELLLPEAQAPAPAVVIVHGSGPASRNNSWARMVAELFRSNGIAVLLTDKRGSGQSGGDWRTAGFEELAEDALAGVRALAMRPEVDKGRIGLVGLSQGGRIVPLAASRSDDVAFVVSVVSDAVTFPEQSFMEMANTARQRNLSAEDVSRVIALNAAAGRFLMGGSWDDYARAREALLLGPAAEIARGFPSGRDAPIWTFLRKVMTYDPIPFWMMIDQPALILFGAEDEKDNVPVAESVRRLHFAFDAARKTNARIVVFPGLGHSLMNGDSLAPEVRSTVRDWLRQNASE